MGENDEFQRNLVDSIIGKPNDPRTVEEYANGVSTHDKEIILRKYVDSLHPDKIKEYFNSIGYVQLQI